MIFLTHVQGSFRLRRRKERSILFRRFQVEGSIYDLFLRGTKCSSARTGSGVSNVFDRTGVESVGVTFRPLFLFLSLRILSRTRDNPATNPWWPPADKHTAVKRYDILSLRELRRGSCGNVRVRREKSIFERHHGKSLHLVLCAVYLCYYRPRKYSQCNVVSANSNLSSSTLSQRLFNKFEMFKFL